MGHVTDTKCLPWMSHVAHVNGPIRSGLVEVAGWQSANNPTPQAYNEDVLWYIHHQSLLIRWIVCAALFYWLVCEPGKISNERPPLDDLVMHQVYCVGFFYWHDRKHSFALALHLLFIHWGVFACVKVLFKNHYSRFINRPGFYYDVLCVLLCFINPRVTSYNVNEWAEDTVFETMIKSFHWNHFSLFNPAVVYHCTEPTVDTFDPAPLMLADGVMVQNSFSSHGTRHGTYMSGPCHGTRVGHVWNKRLSSWQPVPTDWSMTVHLYHLYFWDLSHFGKGTPINTASYEVTVPVPVLFQVCFCLALPGIHNHV